MKHFNIGLVLLSLVLVSVWNASLFAKAKEVKQLKKSLDFEDLLVQGKYHFSDEAVTTVEADKILDSLLGIRKNFDDRIKRSARRQ